MSTQVPTCSIHVSPFLLKIFAFIYKMAGKQYVQTKAEAHGRKKQKYSHLNQAQQTDTPSGYTDDDW